jgi:C-terminal processing protease CtpA/Prc
MKFLSHLFVLLFLFVSYMGHADGKSQEVANEQAQHKAIVQSVTEELNKSYIAPDKAKRVSAELLRQLYSGGYEDYDAERLVKQINKTFYQQTQDPYLELLWSTQLNEPIENTGLVTEMSDEYIGYVAITGDLTSESSSAFLNDAINKIKQGQAVILDLRQAGTISIENTLQLLSHFLENQTSVGLLEFSKGSRSLVVNATQQALTMPLYVLTSNFLAGEWELFLHVLKQQQRAVLVGELTMGVDTLVTSKSINEHLYLTFPNAKLIPTDNLDSWGEIGVEPQHVVKADKALIIAYDLIKRVVLSQQ